MSARFRDGQQSASPLAAFTITLSAALLAAAIELLVWAWTKVVLHDMIFATWQLAWLTPASTVLIFLPLAIALFFGVRAWSRAIVPRTVVFLPALAASFGVFFLFHPQLHLWASVVLAIGVAMQTARVAAGRFYRYARVANRIGLSIALLAAAAGLSLNAWRLVAEKRTLRTGPVAPKGAPNVLLLVLDTVRASGMSLYGYERPTTPALERFARRGVTFQHAFSTSSWTLTSHASMFTGRYPHEFTANWTTPLDRKHQTLAEVLSRHGYATAGFVGNLPYTSRETGLDRGFAHYEDYVIQPSDLIVSASLGRFVTNNPRFRAAIGYHDVLGRRRARDLQASLIRWLEDIGDRPFFAFVNYYDAHEPYLPPKPFNQTFGPAGFRNLDGMRQINARMAERGQEDLPVAEWPEERRAYDQSLAYLDSEIGALLDGFEKSGRLRNTVVVITSDHGELFGEHGLLTHGNSLYLPLLHVPLVIAYPARLAPDTVRRGPVTLRDLSATIMDLVGIGNTGTRSLPGQSMLCAGDDASCSSTVIAELDPPPNGDGKAPVWKGPMKSIVNDRQHYIRNGDGQEELYDWQADPLETHDLDSTHAGQSALQGFRAILESEGATPK